MIPEFEKSELPDNIANPLIGRGQFLFGAFLLATGTVIGYAQAKLDFLGLKEKVPEDFALLFDEVYLGVAHDKLGGYIGPRIPLTSNERFRGAGGDGNLEFEVENKVYHLFRFNKEATEGERRLFTAYREITVYEQERRIKYIIFRDRIQRIIVNSPLAGGETDLTGTRQADNLRGEEYRMLVDGKLLNSTEIENVMKEFERDYATWHETVIVPLLRAESVGE